MSLPAPSVGSIALVTGASSGIGAGYDASKAYLLMLSEAVNEEVFPVGVTVTAVCPGPVRTDFHELHGADFTKQYPRAAWISAERVAKDALAAADHGRRSVVPGKWRHKLAFGAQRHMPSWSTLPMAKRFRAPPNHSAR